MNFDFSQEQIIFLYGHCRKQAKDLQACTALSKITRNQEAKLYDSIADKLLESCPTLAKLNKF